MSDVDHVEPSVESSPETEPAPPTDILGSQPKPPRRKAKRKQSTLRPGVDLVEDSALNTSDDDQFDHKVIARVVADLTLDSTPPVNIALWGPWGSGKTSFYGLLNERINKVGKGKARVVRYDAWKYGGRALKKNFLHSVGNDLGVSEAEWHHRVDHGSEQNKLKLNKEWLTENYKSLLWGALVAFVVALAWFLIVGGASWIINARDHKPFWSQVHNASKGVLGGAGTVLGLAFGAMLVGPKVLESAVVKVSQPAPETDDEFATEFQNLVSEAVDINKGERLVVFIDELDRCAPEDVVQTLIDIKTFLDMKGCVFIVAADREVLERALRKVPQATPVRDEDPYYSTPGAFLDKIFQHRIPLPPLRTQALSKFARDLVEDQGGIWNALRHPVDNPDDDELFLLVTYTLIPAHVKSPRRVKALLNNYATNVRIAEARGINWFDRAAEIACLTTLQTEFPTVADHLQRIPTLLTYLRDGTAKTPSAEVERIVAGYRHVDPETKTDDDSTPTANPAGLLLNPTPGSTATEDPALERANKVLNAQLRSYIQKIAVRDVPDPRPDLFYLQSAGMAVGIEDPALGHILDDAPNSSATSVVDAFSSQPAEVIAAAIRVLVQTVETERGPERANLIEAACRLAEHLDDVDLHAVAPYVAGGVLSDVTAKHWPKQATPGALRIGVIAASDPLVQGILKRQSADELAADGILERFIPVLALANPAQATLLTALLTSVYESYPDALHEALATLPLAAANRLFAGARDQIDFALVALTAERISNPETEADTPGERWANLMASVMRRNDDAGGLISAAFELGQRSTYDSVQEQRVNIEDNVLERVTDPERRNLHALLGLQFADAGDSEFWADILTDGPANQLEAAAAFERLISCIPTEAEGSAEQLGTGAEAVIGFLEENYDATALFSNALAAIPWPADTALQPRRAALHAAAHATALHEPDEALDDVLVQDVFHGIPVFSASKLSTGLASRLVSEFSADMGAALEELLAARATTEADVVAVLHLRLAAAARTGRNPIGAAEILTAQSIDGNKELLTAWLQRRPALADVQQVLGKITVYTTALGEYADGLNRSDRTTLWVDLESRDSFSIESLQKVGRQGVDSGAVEHMAAKILAATQQKERDDLVSRLATAKLKETPAHKAATELVRALLDTGKQGNVSTAARVAMLSGGVVSSQRVTLKTMFDTAVQGKNGVLNKSEMEGLQKLGLLSKPKKGWLRILG